MELKVWVEGIQRIVCGVTESTSCQDVVYALAHATAQTGRFTLVERWRSNERLLAPHETPLKILMKWGEYASEVQLILRRSSPEGNKTRNLLGVDVSQGTGTSDPSHNESKLSPTVTPSEFEGIQPHAVLERNRDIRKSLTFSGGGSLHGTVTQSNNPEVQMENVAIVEPTLQSKSSKDQLLLQQQQQQSVMRIKSTTGSGQKSAQSPTGERLMSEGNTNQSSSIYSGPKKLRELPPYRDPPAGPTSPLRSLPPYREPPAPNQSHQQSNSPGRSTYQQTTAATGTSPGGPNNGGALIAHHPHHQHQHKEHESSPRNSTRLKRNLVQEYQECPRSQKGSPQLACSGPGSCTSPGSAGQHGQQTHMVTVAYTQRYVELIRLVNRQRDTINAQQADLTKFDAEILYWETKNRQQTHHMDFISQEVNRLESTGRVIEQQLKDLTQAEEESEIVRQQEKTLKSEITLLRSKLANCETELLQCKNKIRLVMEELALEQHTMSRELDERQVLERKMIAQVEHLQEQVQHVKQSTELASQCAESLKFEVSSLEAAIVEKKMQVERLVTDMKEANLQSLTVASQDDQVKHLLEGAQKPGSTRKIIGSPRQLETAVPTSKNPHGVWV